MKEVQFKAPVLTFDYNTNLIEVVKPSSVFIPTASEMFTNPSDVHSIFGGYFVPLIKMLEKEHDVVTTITGNKKEPITALKEYALQQSKFNIVKSSVTDKDMIGVCLTSPEIFEDVRRGYNRILYLARPIANTVEKIVLSSPGYLNGELLETIGDFSRMHYFNALAVCFQLDLFIRLTEHALNEAGINSSNPKLH